MTRQTESNRSHLKKRVFHFINQSRLFINFIYALIIVDMIALVLGSYKEIAQDYGYWLRIFELFTVFIFTVEYLLRVWTADLYHRYRGSALKKRIRFVFSTYGLIDLAAILPFYLPFIVPFNFLMLRLFRLLRIFKLGRYSRSLQTISKILRETRAELALTVFAVFILLVLSATLMYYIEGKAQPEKFASIGHSLWWSIATLTTVGYGDVYPITPMGKVLSALIALIGIGFVALPTGIISSAFIRNIQQQKEKKQKPTCTCPNCGTEFKPD